jgi:hypothetical protein
MAGLNQSLHLDGYVVTIADETSSGFQFSSANNFEHARPGSLGEIPILRDVFDRSPSKEGWLAHGNFC